MATTDHPAFRQPEHGQLSVWRYMDFPHLVSMLEHGALWFSSVAKLDDPFEAFPPIPTPIQGRDRELQMASELELGYGATVDELFQLRQNMAPSTYVNCWNLSEYESAAFWNLYGHGGKTLAIQSKYSKLDDVLDDLVYLGCVDYLAQDDYKYSLDNAFRPFMHKRLSFVHEKEVRALFTEWRRGDRPTTNSHSAFALPRPGNWVEVDFCHLIESIWISPLADIWLVDLVERMLRRYGYTFPVQRSQLLTPFRRVSP